MDDSQKLIAVMEKTGADCETARAALEASGKDVDTAVRILSTFELRKDAARGGGYKEQKDRQRSGKSDDQAKDGDQVDQEGDDAQIPLAGEILDAIKEIWKKGNASRLDIEKGGKSLLSVSLTVGTIGLVLAPVAALIGIGAALITDYTITITLDNGTKINVNEFAIKRKKEG